MKRFVVSLLLSLSLSACALTVDEVDIAYRSQKAAAAIGGADGIQVSVSVSDARKTNQDRIGVKKNGYGMEMADIVARQNIPSVVSQAIESELSTRGFRLGKGQVFVLVDVNRFISDFKNGFMKAQAVAEVMLTAQVRNADGKLVYTKVYSGEGIEENIMIFSGKNAKAAIEKAFTAAVGEMAADSYFLQSLTEAQRTMGVSVAPRPTS